MNKTFKGLSRLDKLYLESEKGLDLQKISSFDYGDIFYGYQVKSDDEPLLLNEDTDLIGTFMRNFEIGRNLSSGKWSDHAKSKVVDAIKGQFNDLTKEPDADFAQLFTRLQNAIVGQKYNQADVAVVARTETANMRSAMQLLNWQEAGLKEVVYRTEEDDKVRPSHQRRNGEVYEIEYLLNNDRERIPVSESPYNCRCRYEPHLDV